MFVIVIMGIYGIMIKTDAKEIVVILLMLAYLTRVTSPNAPVPNPSSGTLTSAKETVPVLPILMD